jgi:hypothetical protein
MKVSPRGGNADAFEDSIRPPDASLKACFFRSTPSSAFPRPAALLPQGCKASSLRADNAATRGAQRQSIEAVILPLSSNGATRTSALNRTALPDSRSRSNGLTTRAAERGQANMA